MNPAKIIDVKGINIRIIKYHGEEYICITDIAKGFGSVRIIENWLRNKGTIEFLGVWESLNNDNFNSIEFEGIKNEAGGNKFVISVKKWIKATNAIGLSAKAGKYNSGTYAQKDIALEFCSWVSPEFKLYLIKEFQKLRAQELKVQNLDWNLSRFLSSINYRIQTDAIKNNIISKLELDKNEEWLIYAKEADILNYALFGKTAKKWREENPNLPENTNIRDYATIAQLVVLANMESSNAKMIENGLGKEQRLKELNEQAIRELLSLENLHKIFDKQNNNLFSSDKILEINSKKKK